MRLLSPSERSRSENEQDRGEDDALRQSLFGGVAGQCGVETRIRFLVAKRTVSGTGSCVSKESWLIQHSRQKIPGVMASAQHLVGSIPARP